MLLYDLYVCSVFSMVKIFTNYLGAISRFSLQACLSFAMFVGLRWLPLVASSPNKHLAKSFAGLSATIAGAAV